MKNKTANYKLSLAKTAKQNPYHMHSRQLYKYFLPNLLLKAYKVSVFTRTNIYL